MVVYLLILTKGTLHEGLLIAVAASKRSASSHWHRKAAHDQHCIAGKSRAIVCLAFISHQLTSSGTCITSASSA